MRTLARTEPMIPDGAFYSQREACEILGVDPKTFRSHLDEARIPDRMLTGVSKRYKGSEIKRWWKKYLKI